MEFDSRPLAELAFLVCLQFNISRGVVPADLPVNSNLFWPIPTSFLSGDLLGLYGGQLVFMASYEADSPMVVTVDVLLQVRL